MINRKVLKKKTDDFEFIFYNILVNSFQFIPLDTLKNIYFTKKREDYFEENLTKEIVEELIIRYIQKILYEVFYLQSGRICRKDCKFVDYIKDYEMNWIELRKNNLIYRSIIGI